MSASVIELSNYLEKRISQKSSDFEKSAASLDEVGNVISVGDGANDINLIKHSGIGVSYKGKPILNQVADVVFNHTNLKGMLYLQDYKN